MRLLTTELSVAAQTAYVQLFEATLNAEHFRSVADLNGSFNAKQVKGKKYWYFQYFDPKGALRQTYVGPDNERTRRLVQRTAQPGLTAGLEPLARMASSLGCTTAARKHARVLRRLAEYGFFKAGGLLVGTHAFLAYGNLLGVRWGTHDLTQDIDFAHSGKSLSLALPANLTVETAKAIDSLDMGFLPISGLDGKTGGTFVAEKEPDFRLDFLTTRHRGHDQPFVHPQLNVTLQPLPFMEFSLEHVEQAVIFSSEHIVLVNVPEPARFALHKLIVHGERRGALRLKATKDLAQAAHLVGWLWRTRPDAITAALDDIARRGRGWTGRFRTGVEAMLRAHSELLANEALYRALTKTKQP